MAGETSLPFYINGVVDEASLRGFQIAYTNAGNAVEQRFKSNFAAIKKAADQALAAPRTSSGGLDVNAGALRQRADSARIEAQGAREIALALREVEGAERQVVLSAVQNARARRDSAKAYEAEAQAAERLQEALNRRGTSVPTLSGIKENTQDLRQYEAELARLVSHIDPSIAAQQQFARSTAVLDQAMRRGDITQQTYRKGMTLLEAELKQNSASTRANRQGYIQLGQQLQDVAIQAQLGVNPIVILTQQGTQAAFALSQMGGAAGKVGAILGSPWTIAIGAAVGATYLLYKELTKTSEAMGQVELASNQLGSAQSSLAEYFDKSSDSIAGQNELLKLNARLKAINLRSEAAQARKDSEKTLGGATNFGYLQRAQLGFTQWDNKFNSTAYQNAAPNVQTAMRNSANVGNIVEGVRKGTLSKDDALRLIETQDFTGLRESKENVLKAILKIAEAAVNDEIAKQLDVSLAQGSPTTALKKAGPKGGTPRTSEPNTASISQVRNILLESFGGVVTSTTGGKHTKGSDHYAGRAIDFVPKGGVNSVSKDQIREALAEQGISIRRNKAGVEQLFGPGDKGHSDHYHVAFQGGKGQIDSSRVNERLQREAEQRNAKMRALAEYAEDAQKRINSIGDSFKDITPAQQQVNSLMGTLLDLSTDIDRKVAEGLDPDKAKAFRDQIAALKASAPDAILSKPYDDALKAARERADVDALLLQGRYDEAEAAQRIIEIEKQSVPLTEKRRQEILGIVQAERQRAAALRDQGAIFQEQLNMVQGIRSGIEDTVRSALSGKLSGKSLIGSITAGFKEVQVKTITESLFGPALREMEDALYGGNGVRKASDQMVSGMSNATTGLQTFTDALGAAAQAAGQSAANDNPLSGGDPFSDIARSLNAGDPGSIVAGFVGQVGSVISGDLSRLIAEAANPIRNIVSGSRAPTSGVGAPLDKFLSTLGIRLPKVLGGSVSKVLEGAMYGQVGGGIAGSFGARTSSTGSSIGGAFGSAAFKALAPKLFSSLGSFAGPLGSIAGGLIGGLVGGVLKKTPKASATVSGGAGGLRVASITGNSASRKKSSGEGADAVISTIEGLVEQLGGTLNADAGNVSVGIRKGNYRVDPTGQGRTKGAGVIDFGEDSAAAIKAATMDLIKDGVISGLRAGTQTLLQNAKDLETGLSKALKFESVFQRLKTYDDPVGAALDTLDREFTSLKSVFADAGASAAEYAELERLYGKERAKAIEEATNAAVGTLKNFYTELTTGENGRSLRDRLAASLPEYDKYKTQFAAGDFSNADKFTEAAKTVLDLQRQIDGSQIGYFNRLDEITGLTKLGLDGQTTAATASANRAGLTFGSSANDNTPVISAVDAMNANLSAILNGQLNALNINIGNLPAALAAKLGGIANSNAAGSSAAALAF